MDCHFKTCEHSANQWLGRHRCDSHMLMLRQCEGGMRCAFVVKLCSNSLLSRILFNQKHQNIVLEFRNKKPDFLYFCGPQNQCYCLFENEQCCYQMNKKENWKSQNRVICFDIATFLGLQRKLINCASQIGFNWMELNLKPLACAQTLVTGEEMKERDTNGSRYLTFRYNEEVPPEKCRRHPVLESN